jgi:hypothetical protein
MRLLVAAALAATAVFLTACGGPMRPDELGRSVDTLTSSAAEGRLIAVDVARARTKDTFARVRARELGETVDHEAEKLTDATPRPEIASQKQEAIDLAERISEALGQIQTAPQDRAGAAQAAHTLGVLSERTDELSKGL